MNPTSIYEDADSIPHPAQRIKHLVLPVSCGVGHRCSLDLVVLWLWCRPPAAALIRPLTSTFHGCGHKKKKNKNKTLF